MSYKTHTKKPSLPSIQSLLNDEIEEKNKSTLPFELQQLSVSAPIIKESKRSISHSRSISDLSTLKPSAIKSIKGSHKRSISETDKIEQTDLNLNSPKSPELLLDFLYKKKRADLSSTCFKNNISENENIKIKRDEDTGKYDCPFCKKSFTRPSSLRIHTYSHTGEKPFQCPIHGCGREFSVQSNMRRHIRIHKLKKIKS